MNSKIYAPNSTPSLKTAEARHVDFDLIDHLQLGAFDFERIEELTLLDWAE